jgi:hypothetical protein
MSSSERKRAPGVLLEWMLLISSCHAERWPVSMCPGRPRLRDGNALFERNCEHSAVLNAAEAGVGVDGVPVGVGEGDAMRLDH